MFVECTRREESPRLQEWAGITQKRRCVKAGGLVKWPLALSLRAVEENRPVVKLEQWPGHPRRPGDGHRHFCVHVH